MHKAQAKDWAADLSFDEPERAQLLLLLPQRKDNTQHPPEPLLRLAPYHALPTLVSSAVALLRACLPRPFFAAHRGAGPKGLRVAGGNMPWLTGNATGSVVRTSATACEIDSIPVGYIASLRSA